MKYLSIYLYCKHFENGQQNLENEKMYEKSTHAKNDCETLLSKMSHIYKRGLLLGVLVADECTAWRGENGFGFLFSLGSSLLFARLGMNAVTFP